MASKECEGPAAYGNEGSHTSRQQLTMTPPRVPWLDFPDALLLAEETRTKRHPEYAAAKSGDSVAAAKLVRSLVDEHGLAAVGELVARTRGPGP